MVEGGERAGKRGRGSDGVGGGVGEGVGGAAVTIVRDQVVSATTASRCPCAGVPQDVDPTPTNLCPVLLNSFPESLPLHIPV